MTTFKQFQAKLAWKSMHSVSDEIIRANV